MTIEDAKVIGLGSLALLILFLTVRTIYAHGGINIWAALRRYIVVNMSSSSQNEPVPAAVSVPVPLPGTGATAINLPFLAGNLTEAQYIELGARLVDRRGKFVFSGKTLYKIAGGNHDEFLANMRRWRGEEIEEAPHVTPIVGRATNAQFDHDYPYRPLEV